MLTLKALRAALWRRLTRSGVAGGPPPERDFSLGVPFGYAPVLREEPRIGAVVHMFHPQLAEEFATLLRALGPGAQVMITTDTAAKRETILAAFAAWPAGAVEVRLVPNRGRDIAPKLTAFTDRYPAFDLLLFLHSKLTDYSPEGRGWREKLLAGLVGDAATVASIRAIFEAEPRTGLVFPQHHEAIRPFTGWEGNFRAAAWLARRWGLRLNWRGEMDFPSGSMFWARPAALAPILDLGLTVADFPEEGAQRDGTIAHAVERLFALAAEQAGFCWFKVAAPEWYARRDTIVTPGSEAELRALLDGHRRCLLETMAR